MNQRENSKGVLRGKRSASLLLYDALVERVGMVDSLNLFSFVPFSAMWMPMAVTFGACGLFVGILGSWTSIRKFMDV